MNVQCLLQFGQNLPYLLKIKSNVIECIKNVENNIKKFISIIFIYHSQISFHNQKLEIDLFQCYKILFFFFSSKKCKYSKNIYIHRLVNSIRHFTKKQ